MTYAIFLLAFLGELGFRAVFGLAFDPLAAFGHAMAVGLIVLAIDCIAYSFRQFRRS